MAAVNRPIPSDVVDRLLQVARQLGTSADLNETLHHIIDAMRDLLDADRATVFEFDDSRQELYTTVSHGMDGAEEQIRIPVTTGLAGEAARTRTIINVSDAYQDSRFNQDVDRQTGYRTRSILTIPLIDHDGHVVGVTQVLNKRHGSFTGDDEQLAEALASHAAVALKRGRLIEDRLVREKLERDLALARLIQQRSLPDRVVSPPGFDIAAWSQPAEETGGDVYDVIECDGSESSCGRVVLLLADATGHGVGPALSVTQLRSMMRMAVRLGADLADIARHVNHQLCDDLPEGRFITAWFGEIDAANQTLRSFSTGQAPLLHYHGPRNEIETLQADTLPLGVLDELNETPSPPIPLEHGDCFVILSDGIFEARNAAGEDFGVTRAQQVLQSTAGQPSCDIIERLREVLDQFTGDRPADDDRTGLVIQKCRD